MKKRSFISCGLILLLIGSVPLLAQEADEWTPAFSMKYHAIQGTALSPDGEHIAYVVREPLMEGEKSEYRSHIWVVSRTGDFNVQFTQGEKSCSSPAFSPDGTHLAFLSGRSGKNQVWMLNMRGGEAQQITDAENGVSSFQWSPAGDRIAYTMRDLDTEEEKKAKREKRDVILVDQNFKRNHLYTTTVMPNDTGERPVQRVTAGDFHVLSFDWSPDGRTFAFSHQPDPTINTARSGRDISLVPADSGAVTPLVHQDGSDNSPVFSPDGQTIAFTSNGGQPEPIGLNDVFVVDADGGTPRKLGETPDRNAFILGWTADGNHVLLGEAVRTSRHVLALPVDDNVPRLANNGDVTPNLGAASLVTAGTGVYGSASYNPHTNELAYTFQDTDTPADVYIAQLDGSKTQLTNLHEKIAPPPMGRTELLSWPSKHDGMEIEGLLTYPIGYQDGDRVPLILQVHGGPAGVFTQGFTGSPSIYMTQYFAQKGYAVLRPNPRGSTGYGKEFRYANFMDWGYGDFDDLMSGVDQVIEMGIGDEDRLFLMGWSYGGYMTSFAVTRTDRFKAASMGAGLPNLISMVSTTDIPDYLVGHLGDEFWNDYETYEKHSAIYHIKNVTTPTQVIHGANDLRVPFTQGQEFYVALKRRGVATEFVVYPRTPHGPREPKFLMDVSDRILTWFEKFMPPDE